MESGSQNHTQNQPSLGPLAGHLQMWSHPGGC